MKEVFELEVTPTATRDIDMATAHYDSINPELGTRFLKEVASRLRLLRRYWAWHQVRYRQIRQAKVIGFPYWVHFKVNETQKKIRVVFVQHERRNRRAN